MSGLWGLGVRSPGRWLWSSGPWSHPINPPPSLPTLTRRLRCCFPANGWGQPKSTPGPTQSPRVAGPHNLAAKQDGNGGRTAEGMHGWSSYQLRASRLLGWGLSGPLSCFVAKGAQDPGQSRSPHPAPGPGAARQMGVQEPQ